MLAFPFLAIFGSVAALALILGLFRHWFSGLGLDVGVQSNALELGPGARFLLLLGLTYLARQFQRVWSMAMRVALSLAAIESFRSETWTVGGVLAEVRARIGGIATFVMLDAGVRRLLDKVRQRAENSGLLGRVISRAADLAWWATRYFVVPVLAWEDAKGFDAVKRSAALFKATWGQAFLGRLRVDAVWGFAILATGLGMLLFGWLEPEDPSSLGWFMLPPLVIAVPLSFFVGILDTIYRAALYLFAAEAARPDAFDDQGLDAVFTKGG